MRSGEGYSCLLYTSAADDERLRDLINGIGTSLRSGLPAGTRGRHAAHAKVALDEIDEPATADNIVEFKPVSYTHLDVYKRQVEGTPIDYPVVSPREGDPQGFYLNHDFDRNWSFAGCPYRCV